MWQREGRGGGATCPGPGGGVLVPLSWFWLGRGGVGEERVWRGGGHP